MNITELRNKRAALWNTMEGFLNTHRNDMGVLSAEDDATYSKMEAELDALTNEVKRMERRDAHEAELNKPMSEPLTAAPEKTAQMDRKSGRASDAYKEDFGRHLRGKALLHNVLSTSPDVDGGFLVPTDFEHNIVTALDEENVIRRLAKVITTHKWQQSALINSITHRSRKTRTVTKPTERLRSLQKRSRQSFPLN